MQADLVIDLQVGMFVSRHGMRSLWMAAAPLQTVPAAWTVFGNDQICVAGDILAGKGEIYIGQQFGKAKDQCPAVADA